MPIILRILLFLFLLCPSFSEEILAHEKVKTANHQDLRPYLLPLDHPLQPFLKLLFSDSQMFGSGERLKQAGFNLIRGHNQLMVASYPTIPYFLFKKFPDSRPQDEQLENFIKRIKGAEIIRNYVQQNNFKHIVVPHKWIYELPKAFTEKYGTQSYILVVENMDIHRDWKDPNGILRQLYYNMDIEMLTELCLTLHALNGCDSLPRNQPFTRTGKIAFIDTEHVGRMKGHFLKHIVPALNPEMQAYAFALWTQLEEFEKQK